jgi:hypothetical protein
MFGEGRVELRFDEAIQKNLKLYVYSRNLKFSQSVGFEVES